MAETKESVSTEPEKKEEEKKPTEEAKKEQPAAVPEKADSKEAGGELIKNVLSTPFYNFEILDCG